MCFAPVISAIASIGSQIGTALGGVAGTAGAAGAAGGLSTAFTIGGGLLSAYGQMQNARAAEASARASARVSEQNARAQERANLEILEAGREESDKARRQAALTQGTQRAAMAANGVDVTSADAIDLIDDSRWLAEADAFAIRENARRRAQGGAVTAANYRADADSARMDAASARSAAFYRPLGTILTTGAKVGSKYSAWAADDQYERMGSYT